MSCKKESTCFKTGTRRVIQFGPTRVVANNVPKKMTQQKFVSYGVNKNVECGKFTVARQVKGAECCTCKKTCECDEN